ncbi:MAG TPA: CheR family methyltransferase [Candidatus Sulfotelmatobacter sp.]|nr:CheR family methyltransferase [Candidatus Sulfotelmatobacter sp.]
MSKLSEDDKEVEDLEIALLLEGVYRRYGYDFRDYSLAHLRRRLRHRRESSSLPDMGTMLHRVLSDRGFFELLLRDLSISVTEMFRDPGVYRRVREEVVPRLMTWPFVKIWHAGCATGEEVYSMAILLDEAGLLHKSLLYATDLNPTAIEAVRSGIFPLRHMKQYSENYILSGGKKEFSSYYTALYDRVKFDTRLTARMTLATHNLVSDRSFNEFQMIFCRNVLIYFDKNLQDKVLQLFDESLEKLGFLVLGSKENIRFHTLAPKYVQLDKEKIWRKMM